ncbi:hypothetical protein ABHF33_16695 [Chitinibacter sp. FCG-7]|uniref:Solute-binding protein family 3/N-terminal domain-containing protein n=1 Tax=Chitinibacter mangrovi TaxID=3153927 RepID=A0AAU7F9R4_9NEIS
MLLTFRRSALKYLLPIALWAILFSPDSQACSRTIQVGVSPITQSLIVSKDQVQGGIYIDALREVSRKTGCKFDFIEAPFVRTLHMFSVSHEVDLIPIAIQRTQLEQAGDFIPIVKSRIALISYGGALNDPIKAMERGELKINIVRGAPYASTAYIELIQRLRQQGALEEVAEPNIIARKLQAGRIHAAIMPPTTFYQAMLENQLDPKQVHITLLTQIPLVQAGAYLSKTRLTPTDYALLHKALSSQFQSPAFWQQYKKTYPGWILKGLEPAVLPR